jgi:hypothetical protein
VRSRGDIVGISPPFRAENKMQTVGPKKSLCTWVLKFYFTVSVISAMPSLSRLLHPKYPPLLDCKRWPQIPYYKDPARHFLVHLKKCIQEHNLTPTALGVKAILSEVEDISDEEPSTIFEARENDDRRRYGMMWSEEDDKYIKIKRRDVYITGVTNRVFRENRHRLWQNRKKKKKVEARLREERAEQDILE